MGALPVPKISVEEYLARDRVAEIPSEYHDGEMFPVGNDSIRHAEIVGNIYIALKQRLQSSRCRVLLPTRVRASAARFFYPAIHIICGQPALTDEHLDTVTNPKLICEVLSPSTANYDYGGKFQCYRALPSLEEYVLIAQDHPRVEVFRRKADTWVLSSIEGLEATVTLEAVGIDLALREIYDEVEFNLP